MKFNITRPFETVAILLLPLGAIFLLVEARFLAAALYVASYAFAACGGGVLKAAVKSIRSKAEGRGKRQGNTAILFLVACGALVGSYALSRQSGLIGNFGADLAVWQVAVGAGFMAGLLVGGKELPETSRLV